MTSDDGWLFSPEDSFTSGGEGMRNQHLAPPPKVRNMFFTYVKKTVSYNNLFIGKQEMLQTVSPLSRRPNVLTENNVAITHDIFF